MKIHPSWFVLLLWICLVLGCVGAPSNSNRNAKPSSSPSPALPANADSHTRLEWAKTAIQEKRFDAALGQLDLIPKDASEYKEAQTLIAEAKKGMDQRRQTQESLLKRYDKLCKSRLYQFQIEERLQRENFHMDDSKFETAPDGSTGVKRYFSKTTVDGFVIKMTLQNAYSVSAYYCNADVQDPQ